MEEEEWVVVVAVAARHLHERVDRHLPHVAEEQLEDVLARAAEARALHRRVDVREVGDVLEGLLEAVQAARDAA